MKFTGTLFAISIYQMSKVAQDKNSVSYEWSHLQSLLYDQEDATKTELSVKIPPKPFIQETTVDKIEKTEKTDGISKAAKIITKIKVIDQVSTNAPSADFH